jgi:translation initiation factor IF-2
MTGQQLRKELEHVDFGVKPTDREIPEAIANGVVRFLARKLGVTPDMTALTGGVAMPVEMEPLGAAPETPVVAAEEAPATSVAEPAPPVLGPKASSESLHVLRKLSLDDVPAAAIRRQERLAPTPAPAGPSGRGGGASRRPPHYGPRGPRPKPTHNEQVQIKKKEGTVLLPEQITVKEFAEKAGFQVPQVVSALMRNGVMATITQSIDFDTAAIVAEELGVKVAKEQSVASVEHHLNRNLEELLRDEPENLVPRPPIVVIMGHVDHGKTSLLDAIRSSNVVAGEAGGITQAIGAYQVQHHDRAITFLDTPGHHAFTAMRARGAQVTDIVILVVSSEDGVRETTVEAIAHAREAGVPILVAITKIDKPNADLERVRGDLAKHDLLPEEWGGKTPVVPCSAVSKQGIPELLDHVLLLADMEELRANPKRRAIATVIESHLDPALGPLATVIVNTGTLVVGETFVCGSTLGRVRAMMDARGKRVEAVTPSGAVRVSGFSETPQVGDILQVTASEREARTLHEQVLEHAGAQQKRGFADLVARLSEGKLSQLKVVLKADTQGSLEAIRGALDLRASGEVSVKVIHAAVGAVTESDAMMAAASEGMVIAFNVPVPNAVQRTAEREGVRVKTYEVIYALLDEVEVLLQGLLEPVEAESIQGHLEVRGVFMTKRSEQVIGGRVLDGIIKRFPFRLIRGEQVVGQGRITSLRKIDKDIKEAKEGTECGMRTETSLPIMEGDVLEVFTREIKRRAED